MHNNIGDSMLLMCLKIFFVRIIDVSLGTVRTVLTIKDKNVFAALVGFVEVFIWFIIVKDALNTDINSIWIAVFYALGFATGTYIGGLLSTLFTKNSSVSVQVIINKRYNNLIDILYKNGYAVSILQINGYKSSSKILLFIEIKINRLRQLRNLINEIDSNAFVVVSDSRLVYNGYFSSTLK